MFVRDLQEAGYLRVTYVQSSEQVADILTMALARKQFIKLREMLGLLVRSTKRLYSTSARTRMIYSSQLYDVAASYSC